jgi:hypothetical protein
VARRRNIDADALGVVLGCAEHSAGTIQPMLGAPAKPATLAEARPSTVAPTAPRSTT